MHICVFVSVCQALEMNCVCRNGKHTTNKSETKPKKKKKRYCIYAVQALPFNPETSTLHGYLWL